MELTLQHFIIICPLVFTAGFVDAIAGGGGLISLSAYLISGLPVHNAIATNKLSSGMGTSITVAHFIRKGYVPWKIAAHCAVCAVAGSWLGAHIALGIDDYYFKIIMLIILPVTAFYVMRSKALIIEKEPLSFGRTRTVSMLSAFFIGMYDGFYGPGTGTFLLLLLTSMAHMPLKEANGTTKIINLTTNVTSIVVFLINGKTLILLGLVAGVFNALGNYIGAACFDRHDSKIVKPIMIVVLVLFFVRVLYDLL